MTGLKAFALWVAAIATINSIVSWSAGMAGDCRFWSVLALLSLGVFVWVRHRVEVRRP